MKKAVLALLGLVLSLGILSGNAFADDSSKLEAKVSKLIGIDYSYGGTTTKGFDCSGFTKYVFDAFDISLDRSSRDQAKQGKAVDKDDLRAGDLVFFDTGGNGISHVGIYLGDGVFVHASTNNGVIKNKLSESYYAKRYVTARRILTNEQYQDIAR
ncbi:C40 family peptidase [Gorillibacterium timonense]|uniref:C40 family peptidase n=1 Tax=Gorillibacterium timonense TaxID=1689269 RepID=UPI00071DC8CB|nr:C40 family peptidase [Gorillibacterium timonense]